MTDFAMVVFRSGEALKLCWVGFNQMMLIRMDTFAGSVDVFVSRVVYGYW